MKDTISNQFPSPHSTDRKPRRRALSRPLGVASVVALAALAPLAAVANHDVLVEGEEDFDGDGNIGAAENSDGDQVFGTINAALAGGNRNVTIVSSGRFAESLDLSDANGVPGNLKVAAAPGVEAVIGAVLTGSDPRALLFNVAGSSNNTRQAMAGIHVDLPADKRVILSNLAVTNWATGISIRNHSHVTVENCRLSNNKDFGVFVGEQAAAAVLGSSVAATGYRTGSLGSAPDPETPLPGDGLFFDEHATGLVSQSSFIGNFCNGVTNHADKKAVTAVNLVAFDNGGGNFEGVKIGDKFKD